MTFDPARALAQPSSNADRRFLPSWLGDHGAGPAQARRAIAKIGVLGGIEGVPNVVVDQGGAAEMIAGAGQRKRPPKAAKQRQRPPKLNAICAAELARHPTRVGIVDAQPRLHHAQAIAAGGKDSQSSAQPRRVWADFGFLECDECAARFRQRIAQHPRLGPRLADRNHDDTQIQAAAISPAHRSGGFGVIAFEREHAFADWPLDNPITPALRSEPP